MNTWRLYLRLFPRFPILLVSEGFLHQSPKAGRDNCFFKCSNSIIRSQCILRNKKIWHVFKKPNKSSENVHGEAHQMDIYDKEFKITETQRPKGSQSIQKKKIIQIKIKRLKAVKKEPVRTNKFCNWKI